MFLSWIMALRSAMTSKVPTVIIVGATGTGKTKLSISLAQKFKTEVISADSMQIYKSLDIVTAKATPHEQSLVPHHLLDILEPTQCFTVVDFRNRVLKIIDSLTEQGKIPIVVGGTNYYIESIVYKILVENMDDPDSLLWDKSRKRIVEETQHEIESKIKKIDDGNKDEKEHETKTEEQSVEGVVADDSTKSEVSSTNPQILKEVLQKEVENEKQFSNEELHDKLKALDPVMAARLHPNNRRKVLRAMEVWLNSGRLQSELLAEQKESEGQLRRPGATIIFWLKCDQTVHNKRLDDRIDQMVEQGLIAELLDFHERHNRQRILDGQPPDYTKGIFQTLGFKEFHEYLMLSPEARASDPGRKLLEISIENMKLGTRRYARRQNKMVRGRFLEHPHREVPPIYELDTTDVSKWDENVEKKALQIIQSFLDNSPCEHQPLKSEISDEKRKIDGNSRNYCDICERLIIGDKTFMLHLKSIKHQKVVKKKRKMEKQTNEKEKLSSVECSDA